MRKKTLELATKQLAKIRHISPFVRTFTLQQVIGAHILPIDQDSARFLNWVGLAAADQPVDEIGESLKSIVRKAEAQQFCFAIRCVASDATLKAAFDPQAYPPPAEGYDASDGVERLTALFKGGLASLKTSAAKKPSVTEAEPKPKKTPAAKTVKSTTASKTTKAKPAASKAEKPKASSTKTASAKTKSSTKKAK